MTKKFKGGSYIFSGNTKGSIRIVMGITALVLLLVAYASGSASYRAYETGDMILAPDRIYLGIPLDPGSSPECDENVTLLKEGYMLSLDSVYSISTPATDGMPGKHIGIANFSLYKNGEVVKKLNLTQGDFFYYNKTIDGRVYRIIETKVDGIYNGEGTCSIFFVALRHFYQYSDGTVELEIPADITGVPPSEEWNTTFGGNDEDAIMSVQQTGDGGYFLARSINAKLHGTSIWLNKTDAGGNELWNKTIFEYGAQVNSIQETGDDGFVVAGEIIRNSVGNLDAWLAKIDSNGIQHWNKKYGGEEYGETAYSVSQTGDGGYFLAGSTREPGQGIWIIRTDPDGKEKWNRILRKTASIYDMVSSIHQTADGGYIIAKKTDSEFPYYDAKLIKLDPNGSEQWNRTFGGKYDDSFSSVRQTWDGGYIIAGMTELYGHDAWLIKMAPDGNERWNRTFYVAGGSEAMDVRQTQDGFILAGRRLSYGESDALLIKTDPNGNELWRKTFGGDHDDEALLVQQTGDGGYILAGTTKSYGSGNKDSWLIKVSGEPNGTTNPPIASPTETLKAIPTEIHKVSPKAPGFEVFVTITTLLLSITIIRNRRK
ncbi:MAG: hypothetical protein KKG76_11675 [Euryarchaeota archaeon]|nr:hypothetical protein [Euryarchaeota archaeon]